MAALALCLTARASEILVPNPPNTKVVYAGYVVNTNWTQTYTNVDNTNQTTLSASVTISNLTAVYNTFDVVTIGAGTNDITVSAKTSLDNVYWIDWKSTNLLFLNGPATSQTNVAEWTSVGKWYFWKFNITLIGTNNISGSVKISQMSQ